MCSAPALGAPACSEPGLGPAHYRACPAPARLRHLPARLSARGGPASCRRAALLSGQTRALRPALAARLHLPPRRPDPGPSPVMRSPGGSASWRLAACLGCRLAPAAAAARAVRLGLAHHLPRPGPLPRPQQGAGWPASCPAAVWLCRRLPSRRPAPAQALLARPAPRPSPPDSRLPGPGWRASWLAALALPPRRSGSGPPQG